MMGKIIKKKCDKCGHDKAIIYDCSSRDEHGEIENLSWRTECARCGELLDED